MRCLKIVVLKVLTVVVLPAIGGAAAENAASTDPPARPNIVIIMSDDMGFSDIGTYGGEIQTPALDSLAAGGKKFTQFYNTARCCPSRASLLTGLYPHQAGIGHLIYQTPHLGYGDHLTSDSVTLAEVLRGAGYSTYMAGKWHMAPRTYDPKKDAEHWPIRRGFDKFYGTIAGSGNFYDPMTLCRGETLITPENDPEYKPKNYYYTDALSDNAITFLNDHHAQSKEKPFFLYLAYTAAHWPIQAPDDAIAPYRGKYDSGYAAPHAARLARLKEMGLIPEVGETAAPVGEWDKVKNKQVESALMETYAAMVTRMDKGIGKLVEQLRASGQLDNTLIFYLQDNGGCAEDGFSDITKYAKSLKPMNPDELQTRAQPPMQTRDGRPVLTGANVMPGPADTYRAYKENWANVSNSPFRSYKHFVHEGGISTPLIAHWPERIHPTSATQVVRTPAHLIDIMATCLDVTGAAYPTERNGIKVQPMEGVSLAPTLTDVGPIERDKPIFFEHEGNRAVRDGQWKIVAVSEKGAWELYDMSIDRGEMTDLAKQQPDRVKSMAAQWDAWAARSRVLPLGGWRDRRDEKKEAPEGTAKRVVLKQGDALPREKSLALQGKGVSITAEILSGPVEGVIVAQGASQDGFSLYVKDGILYLVTTAGFSKVVDRMPQATLPEMSFTINYTLTAKGDAQLKMGNQRTDFSSAFRGFRQTPAQGISAGFDSETPVGKYPREFPFRGKLGTVTVETID